MAPIYCNRFASLGVATFILMVFMFATLHHGEGPIRKIKEAAASAADSAASSAQQQLCSNDSPIFSRPSFQDSISRLYDNVKHPVTATDYVDAFNATFNITNDFSWHEPLAGEVLIVDMDTRAPDGKNEIFGKDKINWETMSGEEGGGMLSASFLNHFMYAQIHGYDYKFYRAESMEDHHNTWIKPHVLAELLHSYRFVVFIDADATIQHLEVPLEWLFNRWGITNNTSIAMPIDTKQILNGDENASCDSKGNVTLNTGFIIAQALPFTFEMMTAWKTCTNGKRYPKCGVWKQEWSHEQRAFSEYIRYDFNPDGDNIVSIPCDDAMGYPGLAENHKHIISDCKGQFVRHHTIDKSMTKTDTSNAMLQSLTEIMQKTLKKNKHEYWVSEGERTKSFMEGFRGKDD